MRQIQINEFVEKRIYIFPKEDTPPQSLKFFLNIISGVQNLIDLICAQVGQQISQVKFIYRAYLKISSSKVLYRKT